MIVYNKRVCVSFKLTMADLQTPKVEEFLAKIPEGNLEAPWYSNRSVVNNWEVRIFRKCIMNDYVYRE